MARATDDGPAVLDTLLALFTAPVAPAWPDPLAWWMQQCTLSDADVLERLASERWDDGALAAADGEATVDSKGVLAKPGPSARSPVALDDDDLLDAAAMFFDDDDALAASMGDAHVPVAAPPSGRPAALGPAVPVVPPAAGIPVVGDPLDAMDDDDLMILQVPDSLMMTPAPPPPRPPAVATAPPAPQLPRQRPATAPAPALVTPGPARTSAPAPALVDVDEDTFEDMPGFLDSIDLLEKQGGLCRSGLQSETVSVSLTGVRVQFSSWRGAMASGAKHAPVAVVRLGGRPGTGARAGPKRRAPACRG